MRKAVVEIKPAPVEVAPSFADDQEMNWSAVGLALLLCALWGGLAPAIKIALEGFPPLGLAAWRFLISLATLLLWCRIRKVPWRAPVRWQGWLLWLGLLLAAQIGILNVGTDLTSGARSAVFLNTYPLFVALLAHWFIPGDRLTRRKTAGLLVAFAGTWVIFGDNNQSGEAPWPVGDLLVLASALILAILQVHSKLLLRHLTPLQLVVGQALYSLPFFFAASVLLEPEARFELSAPVMASLLYQGVIVAAFCFLLWTHLLKRHPASKLNAFQFTTPVFGVALSWLMLCDPVSRGIVAGVILISLGIYLVSVGTRGAHTRPQRRAHATG